MKLNSGQAAAVDAAVKGFLEQDLRGLTIIGEGGTGKTTCVMTIVERLQAAGLKVLMTAPTNKAVKQLEKSARRHGLSLNDVAFQTLHSALGLAMLPSEENKYVARFGKGVFSIFDVVVVDEISMLGKRITFEYLLPEAEAEDCKLLLMGDDMQLPPVKEKVSPTFDLFPTHRLTQVERQSSDSEILSVTGLLRTAMAQNKLFTAPSIQGNGVSVIKAVDFLSEVVKSFDETTDLDEQRVLAWRNRRVDEINAAIRQKIYGSEVERFELGERVVTGAPIGGGSGEAPLLSTDEECIVADVRLGEVEDEDSCEIFKVYTLVLNPLHADIKQVFAHVLHEDDQERYLARLEYLAERAKKDAKDARKYWARYHKFKELFATIRYCYCITIHRSQGSTYRRVFVDVKDILNNQIRRERQNLLYVGYSRPSEELVINKEKYVA